MDLLTRRKLGRFTTVVAYTSVTLKPWLHQLSTEPGVFVCMRILVFTLSWSFGLQLDWNWKVLIFGNVAKITFFCVSGLCGITWKYCQLQQTVGMTFNAKSTKCTVTPFLTKGGKNLKSVNHYEHLGAVVNTEFSGDKDIQRPLR